MKCRTQQAHKLGYENFVQLGYDRLGRNCYTPADVAAFRDQVAADLVPVAEQLKEGQAARLGLSELRFWDEDTLLPQGNPAPYRGPGGPGGGRPADVPGDEPPDRGVL